MRLVTDRPAPRRSLPCTRVSQPCELAERALGLVAGGGRVSAHGASSGVFAELDEEDLRARGITGRGIAGAQFGVAERLRLATKALAEAGRLRPVIGWEFPSSFTTASTTTRRTSRPPPRTPTRPSAERLGVPDTTAPGLLRAVILAETVAYDSRDVDHDAVATAIRGPVRLPPSGGRLRGAVPCRWRYGARSRDAAVESRIGRLEDMAWPGEFGEVYDGGDERAHGWRWPPGLVL